MTERGEGALNRDAATLQIGPSALHWDGNTLVIAVEERDAMTRRRVTGTIRLTPEVLGQRRFRLDPSGRHIWSPIAPRAHIEVAFDRPGVAWRGTAYLDGNHGTESLEEGFRDWQWSRAHLGGGDTAVIYEGVRRDGGSFGMALRIRPDGEAEVEDMPAASPLPRTRWRMARTARGEAARLTATWEDTPFYARSALRTRLFGEEVTAVHESLSLDRFASGAVQWMLPWRMARRG